MKRCRDPTLLFNLFNTPRLKIADKIKSANYQVSRLFVMMYNENSYQKI